MTSQTIGEEDKNSLEERTKLPKYFFHLPNYARFSWQIPRYGLAIPIVEGVSPQKIDLHEKFRPKLTIECLIISDLP